MYGRSIYAMYSKTTGLTKIGMSASVVQRSRRLKYDGGIDLEIMYSSIPVLNSPEFESFCHDHFSYCSTHGEWFKEDPCIIVEYIKENELEFCIHDDIFLYLNRKKTISNLAVDNNVSRQYISKIFKDYRLSNHIIKEGAEEIKSKYNPLTEEDMDWFKVTYLGKHVNTDSNGKIYVRYGSNYRIKYQDGTFYAKLIPEYKHHEDFERTRQMYSNPFGIREK